LSTKKPRRNGAGLLPGFDSPDSHDSVEPPVCPIDQVAILESCEVIAGPDDEPSLAGEFSLHRPDGFAVDRPVLHLVTKAPCRGHDDNVMDTAVGLPPAGREVDEGPAVVFAGGNCQGADGAVRRFDRVTQSGIRDAGPFNLCVDGISPSLDLLKISTCFSMYRYIIPPCFSEPVGRHVTSMTYDVSRTSEWAFHGSDFFSQASRRK